MTAEEFILVPKHLYLKEHPHAARVLHGDSIRHKKLNHPTLTGLVPYYLLKLVKLLQRRKHLRKKLSPNKNSVTCKQAMTKYRSNVIKMKFQMRKTIERQTESIIGQLQVLEEKKFVTAKTILEMIKNSERVTINLDSEMIYVNNVTTGLTAAVFL